MAVVLLAAWAGHGRPGGPAIIMLALVLPAVLALSPVRLAPAFAAWTLGTFSGATALWAVGEGGSSAEIAMLSTVAAISILAYVRRPSPFLVALAVQIMLVAYFSGGKGAGGSMVAWLHDHGLAETEAKAVTAVFRKTVHFTFYGSVGWVAWRAAQRAGASPGVALRTGLLGALALASFDELRQSSYGSRTGTGWDVLLDLSGAAAFVGLSAALRRRAR